jgi:uncharacterized protein
MHISDPVPRGTSAMSYSSYNTDSVPRAGTSLSMQSSVRVPPRHANTLPSAPNQGLPPRAAYDVRSANSSGGGITSLAYDTSETDYGLAYSEEDQFAAPYSNGYASPDGMGPYATGSYYAEAPPQHGRGFPQQGWQGTSSTNDYDPLYSAASNVLGMAPPPGTGPLAAHPPTGSGYSASHASLGTSQHSPNSSQSTSYLAPPAADSYQGSFSQYPMSTNPSMLDPRDTSSRPSLQRTGTTASVMLRTQKTKAVDLSAPPYTKEYIDQYRQRIKADPDPEAHFLYAKYLIDAAKKIGADAKDQRAVKKYRDMLITESLKVIRRLATQGEPYDEAQFFLANCYGTGTLGLQVDHERAYHLYLQAAKQNHPAASYRVAVCNEIGAGTRREPPRAAAFYRKAASLGDTPAMYKLGMILLNGSLGEATNPRDAINWLKRAAEQADEENPHALHELGLLHEAVNSPLVLHDPVYAKNLFTQAAHLGYTQSQYKLGQCFEYGNLTCPVDPRRSIAWYTKAAEKGDSDAELALSGWYLTGSEGVLKQSDSEAYLWARRAANKGLSKAEYAVGYYAEVGIGIKQDIEFAKRWYMRAAGTFLTVTC